MPGPGNYIISSLVWREGIIPTLLTFTPRLSSLSCAFKSFVRKAVLLSESPDLGVVENQEKDKTDHMAAGRGESFLKAFFSVQS